MPKELNLPEWMVRNNGFDEEKTLKLPDWMIKVNEESIKNDLSTESNEDQTSLRNSSNPRDKGNSKVGIKHLCNDTIESKLESHKIAIECDAILESLNQIEGDFKIISLDLDWPSAISSVISKSSSLHICYRVNACALFSIKNIKSLPKIFVLLLNHSKIRLVGNNIISDVLKIGLDFNLDVEDVLETKIIKTDWDKSTLSCRHNWNLSNNYLNIVHRPPPSRKYFPDSSVEKSTFLFSGKIKYYNDFNSCGLVSEELLAIAGTQKSKLVIGFDLEWPFYGSQSSRVTLMQLCMNSKECFLFHFLNFNSLPKTLVLLLKHPNVILTGLNIKNDIRKLSRDYRVDLTSVIQKNLVELTTFANKVLNCSERWSLARLVLYLTHEYLSKEVRKSNWSGLLSKEQKIYAATDAYASLLCYQILKEKSRCE